MSQLSLPFEADEPARLDVEALTSDQFYAAARRAKAAGDAAGRKRWQELEAASGGNPVPGWCGGALLVIFADGRSRFGRLLSSLVDRPTQDCRVNRAAGGGYLIHLVGVFSNSLLEVAVVAQSAAAITLEEELGVKCYIQEYDA